MYRQRNTTALCRAASQGTLTAPSQTTPILRRPIAGGAQKEFYVRFTENRLRDLLADPDPAGRLERAQHEIRDVLLPAGRRRPRAPERPRLARPHAPRAACLLHRELPHRTPDRAHRRHPPRRLLRHPGRAPQLRSQGAEARDPEGPAHRCIRRDLRPPLHPERPRLLD